MAGTRAPDELINGRAGPCAVDGPDRRILAKLYLAALEGRDPEDALRAMPDVHGVRERLGYMARDGLIDSERRPTKKGAAAVKVVLAGGVFDIIHPGHIHTLREASKLGDVLVVVVATDKTAVRMKRRRPLHAQDQRRALVGELRTVDAAVVGDDEDIFKTVAQIRPQIIALGYDQVHQERAIIDGCKKLRMGVTVARLQSPMPHVSSSAIERDYGDSLHGT